MRDAHKRRAGQGSRSKDEGCAQVKRVYGALAALGLAAGTVTMSAGPAAAEGHGGPPPHGHVLLLGVQWDGDQPVSYWKCVDLAGGNALGMNAHHSSVHVGKAGQALVGAGHLAMPTFGFPGGCVDLALVRPPTPR